MPAKAFVREIDNKAAVLVAVESDKVRYRLGTEERTRLIAVEVWDSLPVHGLAAATR